MAVVAMKHLLEAGVHFGHQTRRWNPKMKPYIFTERNGIYILDLQKTLEKIDLAYNFVKNSVANGGIILFVGTKKQAQESVREEAERCGMPYVNHRWLGGMLTNFITIRSRLDRLAEIEKMTEDGRLALLPKKEIIRINKEREKLERNLGGIKSLKRVPDIVYIVDTKKERIATLEARRLGTPIVAIIDTNCDPDEVDYVIPGNDDAIRAVALLTKVVADAAVEGIEIQAVRQSEISEEEKDESGEAVALTPREGK